MHGPCRSRVRTPWSRTGRSTRYQAALRETQAQASGARTSPRGKLLLVVLLTRDAMVMCLNRLIYSMTRRESSRIDEFSRFFSTLAPCVAPA